MKRRIKEIGKLLISSLLDYKPLLFDHLPVATSRTLRSQENKGFGGGI